MARILVVDDDEEVLDVAAAVLTNLGHAVTCARGPAEALRLVADGEFDALFTDVMMPGGINGFELARRAKAIRPALKILYTTGYSGVAPDRVGETFGPILKKPYRTAELADEIGRLLG